MNRFWKLAFAAPVGSIATTAKPTSCLAPGESALSRAKALHPPEATSINHGELEGVDFWYTHEELLREARMEWGRKHPHLYEINHDEFLERYLHQDIKEAIQSKSIANLESLVRSTEKDGVYKIKLFTTEFARLFLDELAHQEAAGIPIRRPNGMNRYGCILDQIGFEVFLKQLSDLVLRPLAHIIFPNRVALEDTASQYGFVVRYHPDTDVSLSQHADASVVTINICLQPSLEDSPLYFSHVREIGEAPLPPEEETRTPVTMDEAGVAVIHLGQHLHGVSNVTSSRSNMVVWLHGNYGYVRVAPYEPHEVAVNQVEWTQELEWS